MTFITGSPPTESETDGGYATPTHSEIEPSLASYPDLDQGTGTCPWPGDTYVIRDLLSKRIIRIKDGVLGVAYPNDENSWVGSHAHGSSWLCTEKGGWLGFQNTVSGKYIGHNSSRLDWRFIASAEKHDEWEYLTARHHPKGGYVLYMKHWSELYPMCIGGANLTDLVVVPDSGKACTRWEFVKVG